MSGRFDANSNNLSSEYPGIVTRLGVDVAGLSVSDRVYDDGRGHFDKYTRMPGAFARRLRPSDDLIEIAKMSPVYMTAVYAFNRVVRLGKGQKVPIRSITGGLGYAAIQLARVKARGVCHCRYDRQGMLSRPLHGHPPLSHCFFARPLSPVSSYEHNG